MGGIETMQWAVSYPDFMDAAMPLACLPVQIAGRNRMWRKMLMDAILKLHDQIQDTKLGANREREVVELEALALSATPLVGQKGLLR